MAENSATSAGQRRGPGRPFRKGQSGNPGGRPKVIGEIRDLARAHTTAAIGTLIEIMRNTKSPAAARISAARELLDRGWGRPQQDVNVDTGPTLEELIIASMQPRNER